jgi:hypothetical protein
MTKSKNANSHFTLLAISELASTPEPKTASNTKEPHSAQIPLAFNLLFTVIFVILAEKDILTYAEAAERLKYVVDGMPELPDGTRAYLTITINALWNFEALSRRHNIH